MTKQEKRNKYIELIPALEGSKYMANDYAKGQGTRFGVSVAFTRSFSSPEDVRITESILKTAKFTQFVPFISRFLTRIGYDDIESLQLAMSYADHAYNTGWNGAMGDIQKFLIIRYRAKIPFDANVGPRTVAAINAAVRQYGEKQVLSDWYRWRKAYYEGRDFPVLNGKAKNRNGCKKPVCRVIISSRLDKYFGVQGKSYIIERLAGVKSDDDIFEPHGNPLDEKTQGGGNASQVPQTPQGGGNTPQGGGNTILWVVVGLVALLIALYFLYQRVK